MALCSTQALIIQAFILSIIVYIIQRLVLALRSRRVTKKDGFTVGFFHPYCNAGGGGEKVLWCAIRALQQHYDKVDIVVYTGDVNSTPEDILRRATNQLNTPLLRPVQFVFLRSRVVVEAKLYPVFTLLGQSLGSVVLGVEAMWNYLPDVYIDTMGYAFTLPLFSWLGGCKVACYVHYPTITTEMLKRVSERVEAHNNRAVVARNPVLTAVKLLYYRIFAWLYKKAGCSADVVMVNSSWTKEHIVQLWRQPQSTQLVYPPCDITHLTQLKHSDNDEIRIVSLGQFRPEKDHPLQIRTLQIVKSKLSPDLWNKIKLVLIGSCRDGEDEARVDNLKSLCEELEVSNNVEFRVGIPFSELKEQFALGTIGLHTMWNEHFGIGVVECMAAGLIMLSHRTGGPKMDIVDEREDSRTGFLAETAEEYAEHIVHIVNLPKQQLDNIRQAARISVERFSVQSFEKSFLAASAPLFDRSSSEKEE